MFEFAKKLLFAQQLTIEKGTLSILNHKFMILPVDTMVNLIKTNKELCKNFYKMARESGIVFGKLLENKYGMNIRKKEEMLVNVFNLCGWGALELIKNDHTAHLAIFDIVNSPFAEIYGKSDEPVCHTNRGYLAGGATRVYGIEVECVETKCMSCGDIACEFVTAPPHILSKRYPQQVKTQISNAKEK